MKLSSPSLISAGKAGSADGIALGKFEADARRLPPSGTMSFRRLLFRLLGSLCRFFGGEHATDRSGDPMVDSDEVK